MPTNPGFHPDFVIMTYPQEIRASIRKIAASFYVTRHFKDVQIGNSQYWAILVRPTDEFSVYINTDREVLVLISLYETFEIRTLEAYDEFYDLLESRRVDKSVRFLVSKDANIERIIKHYLDQHPEYPIIIPTTLDQLTGSSGNPLLDAVRRNYLLRDLFGYQNPLREETFFFGRQHVVNTVLDMAKSGQNSSLFGLRKSGKTSAVYAIQRKASSFSCNVAVIDCQNPSVHARRYDALLSYVLGEVRKSVGPKKTNPNLGTTPAEVSENFFMHMNNVLSLTKNTVLLIFDEIENISPATAASSHWRTDNDAIFFWQVLRSYVQSDSKGRLSICIVGTSPNILEIAKINDIDNPIYLYAQKRFIPSLAFDETREMIERLGYFMGLEFTPEVIAELQKEFGGHPFFTRQVCSRIHQNASTTRPLRVSVAALERAKSDFYGQLESYLRDIVGNLSKLYPEEYEILKAVANGSKEDVNEIGNEAPDLIDHLIGYNMVERIGNDFDIKFEAVKTILKRIIKTEAGEDRWAEISRRRNKLENEIRVSLFHWCRGVDPSDWSSIINECLTRKRLEALSTSEPAILFSAKSSPLYLSDLLMFLKDGRVLPYLRERRSQVIKCLDCVNKLRKDAHANIVSDVEMIEVRAALDQLELEFSPP